MANVQQLRPGESSYPGQVAQRMGDDAPRAIHVLADVALPPRVDLALVCSVSINCCQPSDAEQRALEELRLLVVSVEGPEVTTATRASALRRNAFVAAMADAVFVPHAVPGGQAELVARQAISRGQLVLTFDDPENARLIDFGARPLVKADLEGAAR